MTISFFRKCNICRVVSILFSCEHNHHRERLTRETQTRIRNSQENHNLLRWFYAYVEKNGTAAVDAYDAYGARVAAQKRREQIELKRKEGARGGSGSETSRTTPTLPAGGSSGGSLSERFVPNDLSVVREMEERETPVMETSVSAGERVREEDEGDLSFEFSPLPQADGVAPATPRALAFPDTPDATTTGRRRHSEESTEVTTTSPAETPTNPPEQKLPTSARSSEDTNGRRPPRALDRWATKARAKLAAAHPDPSSSPSPSPSPLDPNSDAPQMKHSATVEEETVSCCGCVVKRVVRRLVNANPPQSAG